jgi:hypothetical protein
VTGVFHSLQVFHSPESTSKKAHEKEEILGSVQNRRGGSGVRATSRPGLVVPVLCGVCLDVESLAEHEDTMAKP